MAGTRDRNQAVLVGRRGGQAFRIGHIYGFIIGSVNDEPGSADSGGRRLDIEDSGPVAINVVEHIGGKGNGLPGTAVLDIEKTSPPPGVLGSVDQRSTVPMAAQVTKASMPGLEAACNTATPPPRECPSSPTAVGAGRSRARPVVSAAVIRPRSSNSAE